MTPFEKRFRLRVLFRVHKMSTAERESCIRESRLSGINFSKYYAVVNANDIDEVYYLGKYKSVITWMMDKWAWYGEKTYLIPFVVRKVVCFAGTDIILGESDWKSSESYGGNALWV